MEVKVLSVTEDLFSVAFSDKASGQQVVIGLEGDVIKKWNMQTSQLLPTITTLADEIILNHDLSQPFQTEYRFSAANTADTFNATIDRIRENPL